ncbi:hypothetical protein SAMN05216417_12814 [Nitrosospira multiformis]|uniref:WGR domain-containing protein n=1 Tax=Nitrosospira multiformis TaxID=1231 RepID=A0A1I7IVH7_9PROT|nr:hypothetical protein SAMN05216417_12814 [Nitrosospira multiformis]
MKISGKNWENKSAKANLQSSSESRKGTEKGSEVRFLATGFIRACWETAQRWYEVELVRDLLDDWVLMRRWGSKTSRRCGELSHVVEGEAKGRQFIERIHLVRLRRKPAYWRVY